MSAPVNSNAPATELLLRRTMAKIATSQAAL